MSIIATKNIFVYLCVFARADTENLQTRNVENIMIINKQKLSKIIITASRQKYFKIQLFLNFRILCIKNQKFERNKMHATWK